MAVQGNLSLQRKDDNKAVELRYLGTDKTLQYAGDTEEAEHVVWEDIDQQNIIALIPATGTTYDLLLVGKHDTTEESHKSKISYKSLRVEQPSQELIKDLSWPKRSFLRPLRSDTRIQVIVSVGSGVGQAKDLYERAVEPLLHRLVPDEFDVHFTTSADTVTELTLDHLLPNANAGKEQRIVLLSGDGGLVDMLNALSSAAHTAHYRSPDVALLPIGTGNALANSSGILNDNTEGLKSLVWGHPQRLPVFRAAFSPGARYLVDEARSEAPLQEIHGAPTAIGCVVCSWGLHAALVADSDTTEYRKFGAERFKMAAKEALFPADGSPPHAYKGKVKIIKSDAAQGYWQDIDRDEHGYVLSTLVSHLEAGFNISPSSKSLDGVLRLVHFAPLSGKDAMDAMGKAYQGGKHIDDERVSYEAVQALRIEFNEDDANWRRICIDGKIVRVEKGGWVEVRTDVQSGVNLIAR